MDDKLHVILLFPNGGIEDIMEYSFDPNILKRKSCDWVSESHGWTREGIINKNDWFIVLPNGFSNVIKLAVFDD